MSQKLVNAAAVALMICSIVATAVYVERSFASDDRRPAPARQARPMTDSESLSAGGTRVGDQRAPITLVEFTDFQCPACRALQPGLTALIRKWPRHVAVVHRHFPLEAIHPHAVTAARAAECAAAQARFAEFQDELYRTQDSIGVRTWQSVAVAAGVADTSAFARCITDGATAERVQGDLTLARRLDLEGTPSVIIGDSVYTGLDSLQLESLTRALARRRGIDLPE